MRQSAADHAVMIYDRQAEGRLSAQHLSGVEPVPVEELGVPTFAWQI